VKAGEHAGFVSCNEMVLYKMPEEIFQEIMAEMHHYAPMDEQEKIKVQQDQLIEASRDSHGRSLVQVENASLSSDRSVKAPLF